MLNEESSVASGPTWDQNNGAGWREVDRALRRIAKQRAALDASEARWLCEAERLEIWRPLGMVSALDYLERVLGYAPHTALERLRVARALGELPVIAEAFARGELAFSAVRELTRVATPDTDGAWCDEAVGKTVREIEDAVAGRRGKRPSDPPDPELGSRTVRFELSPETFARLRQARAVLSDEQGGHVDGDELVAALCEAVLERASSVGNEQTEPSGRAKFQIALVVCERCDQGWQEGAGARNAVDAATVERARCDAQHVGSIDGEAPERAHQDIPPSVVRFVWRRDGGRCQTPGCRSARGLEIHHLVRRTDGGTHAPSNLTLRCSSCHAAHHKGKVTISGTAPDRLAVRRVAEEVDAKPDKLDAAIVRAQACDALVGLGWKSAIARAAVDEAASHVGSGPLDGMIREALRRCPMPRSA